MNQGWILDVYPVENGMCVWMIDKDGRANTYLDPWFPSFYLKANKGFENSFHSLLESFKVPFDIRVSEKIDFFSGKAQPVLGVTVKNPLVYHRLVGAIIQNPAVTLYNADLNLGQCYFYERNLFPLAFCSFDSDPTQKIIRWFLEDDVWRLEYALPPFRYAHLAVQSLGEAVDTPLSMDPGHRRRGCYVLTLGREWGKGSTYVMDSSEEELIHSLNRHLNDWDPDVILTDWGDSYVFPRLERHSERVSVPLKLSRDPLKYVGAAASHSFFSYGKMIYRAGTRTLYGRLHIDTRNSFSVDHTGLEGLYEVARVAKIPIQRAARCTIGTSLSSMQYDWANRHNRLIPVDKGQTEDFRTADTFLTADRGGLVYEPEVGWHENLVEFDFASMYPEIMVRHNVTPEAVNCACCPDNKVPEIGHHLCRRRGMIPDVLEPLVNKRREYKKLIKQGHPDKDIFKARYDAFKWALVTSFGYLGFRNARFGRIEAHECVNAYSREALLTAKEIAESRGFHFVHAIVDSFWLSKKTISEQELSDLQSDIEKATGLPLGFEGRYRWIHFCSSTSNPKVGVPNRYFGAFISGETKVRGIELRRHDTPLFIKKLEEDLLKIMAEAENIQALDEKRILVAEKIEDVRERLVSGHMNIWELAITTHLSKDPSEYIHDTLSSLAAKKLVASGVFLHAGEAIQYVVAAAYDGVKDWRVVPLAFIEDAFEYDVFYYEQLLDRAIAKFVSIPIKKNKSLS